MDSKMKRVTIGTPQVALVATKASYMEQFIEASVLDKPCIATIVRTKRDRSMTSEELGECLSPKRRIATLANVLDCAIGSLMVDGEVLIHFPSLRGISL